jgi:hypothetical protein
MTGPASALPSATIGAKLSRHGGLSWHWPMRVAAANAISCPACPPRRAPAPGSALSRPGGSRPPCATPSGPNRKAEMRRFFGEPNGEPTSADAGPRWARPNRVRAVHRLTEPHWATSGNGLMVTGGQGVAGSNRAVLTHVTSMIRNPDQSPGTRWDQDRGYRSSLWRLLTAGQTRQRHSTPSQ